MVGFVGGLMMVLALVFSLEAVGFAFSGSACWTSKGVFQMKTAPSSPTDTMYLWLGEKAT